MDVRFLPNKTRVRYVKGREPGSYGPLDFGDRGTVVGHGVMSTGHPFYRVRFDHSPTRPYTAIDPRDIEAIEQ